jgi:glucose/arabinose dehydrogenase
VKLRGLAVALAVAAAGCGSAAPVTAPVPLAAAAAPAQPTVTGDIARDLRIPWGLDFLPDGDALVTQRDLRQVLRIAPDGQVTPAGEITEAEGTGEGGVLGLAVSPDFESDQLVYLYISTATDNRIVRAPFDGTTLGPREPLVVGIPSAENHDGGALEFGPDGLLYAGTGDAENRALAQDPGSLGGKILRMTPDGRPPADNPFPGSVVFSLGHRNVQGLGFDSAGRLWASEFGYRTADELNLIRPGGNYGWPVVEGRGGDPRFLEPAAQWSVAEASPSGIAIVDDVVYMAGLRGQRLWRIPLAGEGVGQPEAFLQGAHGRLRTVAPAPDGSLWITTSNHDKLGRPAPGDDRILRVSIDQSG